MTFEIQGEFHDLNFGGFYGFQLKGRVERVCMRVDFCCLGLFFVNNLRNTMGVPDLEVDDKQVVNVAEWSKAAD